MGKVVVMTKHLLVELPVKLVLRRTSLTPRSFASGCSSGELAGLVTMALKVIEDDGHEGRSQMMRVMVSGARQGMVGDLVEVSHHLSGTAFQLRSKTG
jgi:hypothetical protein